MSFDVMREMPLPESTRSAHRVVVCGEVGSGKSTVINSLLRETTLSYGLVSGERPIIIFRYAKQAGILARFKCGGKAVFTSFSQCRDLKGIASLTVFHTKAHLKAVEITEIPMERSSRISDDAQTIIRDADTLIWTTIASQAWRLSERDAVQKLAQYCPPRRFAAVSRADMLKSHSDRDKILKRLQAEAQDYFVDFHFIYGDSDLIDFSQYEEEGWQGTGGADLLSSLTDGMLPGLPVESVEVESPKVEAVVESSNVWPEDRLKTVPAICAAGLLYPEASGSESLFYGEKDICTAISVFAKDVLKTLTQQPFYQGQISDETQIQLEFSELFVFVSKKGAGDVVYFAVFDKKTSNMGLARKQFFGICEALDTLA